MRFLRWFFRSKKGQRGEFEIDSGLKSLVTVFIVVSLLLAGVPVLNVAARGGTWSTSSALSFLADNGYTAYADPSGTFYTNSIIPNANNTYDLGASLTAWKNVFAAGTVSANQGSFSTSNVTTLIASSANISSLTAATGRTATYVIAASDAPAQVKAQADYLGSNYATNALALQAALDAAAALGGRPLVRGFGTFTGTVEIAAKSNVDVEIVGSIEITAADGNNGVVFNSVTNATWSGVKVYRKGTASTSDYTHGVAILINGATNRTLKLTNCEGNNQIASAGYAAAGLSINGAGGIVEPEIIGGYYEGGGTAGGLQNTGIMCSLNLGGSPRFMNVRGKGGLGGWATGLTIEESGIPIVEGGYFVGGTGTGAYGGVVDNPTGGVVTGATFVGGVGAQCYGLSINGASVASFTGNTILAGLPYAGSLTAALAITQNSAPIITGGLLSPQSYASVFSYDDANNGQFRPFTGYKYRPISMQVYTVTGVGGRTLDIGTTPGGNQIASGLDIGTSSVTTQFTLVPQQVAVDGYLYATPSGAITDASVRVYYTVLYDDDTGDTPALLISTCGQAILNGVSMLSDNGYGTVRVDTTYKNWRITNSHIRNVVDWYNTAIRPSGAMTDVPIYNSIIRGALDNVVSFARGSQNTGGPQL